MGCDIHIFLEFVAFHTIDGEEYWQCFSDRIQFPRMYTLFALMAGVRNSQEFSFIKPRGIPENAARWHTLREYTHCIIDNPGDSEYFIDQETAKDYLDRGLSEWVGDPQQSFATISRPDWHSASWLTSKEFSFVLKTAEAYWQKPCDNPVPKALLATMRSIEKQGVKTRLVFWFDD